MGKPLPINEIMRKAVNGQSITPEEALSLFADESNWESFIVKDPEPRCVWGWKGPVKPPFELARPPWIEQ